MLRVILTALLLCVSTFSHAADWAEVEFEPLDGRAQFTVAQSVECLAADATYMSYLERGETFGCIVEITKRLTTGEYRMESLGNDSTWVSYGMFQRIHSGHRWPFWNRLAQLGHLVYEADPGSAVDPKFGAKDLLSLLDPEVVRILEEMRAAFEPHLQPREAIFTLDQEPATIDEE